MCDVCLKCDCPTYQEKSNTQVAVVQEELVGKVQVTSRIPIALHKKLKIESKRRGCSVNEVIIFSLTESLSSAEEV